jgi:hypothetical protein
MSTSLLQLESPLSEIQENNKLIKNISAIKIIIESKL